MALQAAGFDQASQQPGLVTVFAPSDAAFAKIPPEAAEFLRDPQNSEILGGLLSYHAINNRILTSTELLNMELPASFETLLGQPVTISRQAGRLKINNATIVAADILASNGIIHIIDSVLRPPSSNK